MFSPFKGLPVASVRQHARAQSPWHAKWRAATAGIGDLIDQTSIKEYVRRFTSPLSSFKGQLALLICHLVYFLSSSWLLQRSFQVIMQLSVTKVGPRVPRYGPVWEPFFGWTVCGELSFQLVCWSIPCRVSYTCLIFAVLSLSPPLGAHFSSCRFIRADTTIYFLLGCPAYHQITF